MSLKQKLPNYRSKFEKEVGLFLGDNAIHEPERISFIQPPKQRYYLPDFKTKAGVYIETKGRWLSGDRTKHLWLQEQHPDKRIVLVFMNANVKLNKKSKTSYGDWATKNGLEWYDWKDGIPEELFNANKINRRNTRRSSANRSKSKSRTSKVSN